MHFGTHIHRYVHSDSLLWTLVVLAFLLRVAGVGYGLPLTLVADEPPFILGALQMLQSHTLVPSLHPEMFQNILYYPPYLSYLYLAPFAAIVGITMATWQGTLDSLSTHFLADLSPFFVAARLISITLGAASVFLIYRTAQSLFTSRIAAGGAAFLLTTSLLHTGLSMTGRHWLPVSFLFLLVLYILTREHLQKNKRILLSCITVGVGVGISTIVVVALLPVGLWILFESKLRILNVLRDRLVWVSVGVLALLAPLPTLLYNNSHNYLFGALFVNNKTILGLLLSPVQALSALAYAEPILVILFLAGLVLLFLHNRQRFVWLSLFFLGYVILFYFLTHIEPRFLLPLVPLYALVGGYAIYWCTKQKIGVVFICVLLCIPLCTSLRLSQLTLQDDTRTNARVWALESLTSQDKVLVYADLMRLPTNTESVAELRALDPHAVRRIDDAEALVSRNTPHALNLYTLQNESFFTTLPLYAKTHGYTYLIYQPGMANKEQEAAFTALIASATEVGRWQGFGDTFSISKSTFWSPLPYFFSNNSLGPTIVAYRLQ